MSVMLVWEVKVGGPGVQRQPEPHNEFKASLGCVRLCLKKKMIEVVGEMAQPVRELTAPSEEPTLNSNTYKATDSPPYFQLHEVQCPLLVSTFTRQACAYMYTGKTPIHIKMQK